MTSLAINDVTVSFSIVSKKKTSSTGLARVFSRYEKTPFHALTNISFELKKGDRLAVIGKNGAGKTTLLRVLSEILPPSSGEIRIDGSVHSILTIATGLVMSATCSQNIKLKGLSYGLSGESLESYMQEARKRSQLDKFLFQPVKSLSSGMRSRLIVSMLGVLKPDILIMDEWINVADNKQVDTKHEFAETVANTDIFVLATHREHLIRQHCNKCIVLDQGECVFFGDLEEGLAIHNSSDSEPKSELQK